ncbi:MAG: DUF1538 domain-containing protein [Candidatus Margulisbacteria bacterium]|jgi:hypothetical protein|nr:DUF1538 domain-containing protein [Candidatus Margulisiibacteriota bacterium]
MNKVLQEKIWDAFSAVLPITAIVLIVSVLCVPLSAGITMLFLAGAALLVIGMGFFTLGADMAMLPMGEGIGAQLTKAQNIFLALGISFLMGFIITIAEPDLQVLALQLAASLGFWALVGTVGAGVGLFLAIAVLRVLFGVPLRIMLLVFYAVTFALAFYMQGAGNGAFIPVSFDAGGVTTGPITVPFMLAVCVGVASLRGDRSTRDDSFGFVALCSVGPILSVMALGVLNNITSVRPQLPSAQNIALIDQYSNREILQSFLAHFPSIIQEVAIALSAILVFFLLFQLLTGRYQKRQLARIIIGFFYTFIGLVIFLTGVSVGFIPVGSLFGSRLGASELRWLLVPLSMLIGYFIVAAEPAVHVLNKQVEDVSQGAITQKVMNTGLAVGMALALGLAMLRILYGLPILYILLPGYALALILTFFVPKIFTGIAFDSGGVCSGPLTSTFLLPFAIGACAGSGGNIMQDAFGIVAMVAMMPLVVIQLLGLIYKNQFAEAALAGAAAGADEVIIFEEQYVYG